MEKLGTREVPESDRLVGAGRRQNPAVGGECDGPQPIGVAGKNGARLAVGKIPEPNGVVEASTGQLLPIRADRDGCDERTRALSR